jgi:hypothetical protein
LLYIDNSVGDLKNDVWHKVVYDGIDTPMIYEMRKVKGVFLENLELNDFPVDVQVKDWTVVRGNQLASGHSIGSNDHGIDHANSQ